MWRRGEAAGIKKTSNKTRVMHDTTSPTEEIFLMKNDYNVTMEFTGWFNFLVLFSAEMVIYY